MKFHKDAEIPNQSVVHAVRGGRWSARSGKRKTTPLNQVKLATVGEEQEDAGAAAATGMENYQFYDNYTFSYAHWLIFIITNRAQS